MPRIQLHEDIQPLSEFRANVTSFINRIQKTKRPLVITQHGKSAAVLLAVSEYELLLDRIDLLTDIRTAESQIDNGEGVDHNDVKNHILGTRNG